MKKLLKSLPYFLFITLCYLAISSIAQARVNFQDNTKTLSYQEATNGKKGNFSTDFTNLISGAVSSPENILPAGKVASATQKIPFAKAVAFIAAKEYFFFNTHLHYLRDCRTRLVRHRKSDLIFPFHYFW